MVDSQLRTTNNMTRAFFIAEDSWVQRALRATSIHLSVVNQTSTTIQIYHTYNQILFCVRLST
jgi:hypothetical protein